MRRLLVLLARLPYFLFDIEVEAKALEVIESQRHLKH